MMLKIADVTLHDHEFRVSGDLDFNNVVGVYDKAVSSFGECADLVFDFAGVTSSNSAGIALMIELVKKARLQGKCIKFKKLSDDIGSLLTASGLDELIDY